MPQPFGPDERDDPAAGDRQVDAVEDRQRAAAAGREREAQAPQLDGAGAVPVEAHADSSCSGRRTGAVAG